MWKSEQHRFYQQPMPSVGEFVKVKVIRVTSLGVYTELLEYAGLEGMIVTSELAKTFFRSVHQLAKTGKALCCCVIRVDEKKKYIDLSKKRVTPEDDEACHARYSRAKLVQSLVMRTCQVLHLQDAQAVEEVFANTAWYLDSQAGRKTASLDKFKDALRSPNVLDQCPAGQEVVQALLDTIRVHLKEPEVHLCAVVAVTCVGPDGVDAVKDALRQGRQITADISSMQVKILYKESPYYNIFLETTAREKDAGMAAMNDVISSVQRRILEYDGGDFRLVTKPSELRRTRHHVELDDFEAADEAICLSESSESENEDNSDAEYDDTKASRALADTDVLSLVVGGEDSGIGADINQE